MSVRRDDQKEERGQHAHQHHDDQVRVVLEFLTPKEAA